MPKTIKVKFTGGVLVPLETLDLNEGDEVLVTLDAKPVVPFEELSERSKAAAAEWAGSVDAAKLLRDIYTSRHRGFDCDCIYCAPEQ